MLEVSDIYLNHTHSYEHLKNINYALNEAAIVAITDRNGNILSANDYFCKISKYDRKELIGQNHRILNSGTHSKEFFEEMWNTILNGDIWNGEICNKAKDGSLYWVKTTIVPFKNTDGKIEQFISIRVDITGQKNFERINYLMYHDELTQLPNRRQLLKTMDELIEQAKPFTLFFLDLNRFKLINEHLGHEIGDAFLIDIANFFKEKYAPHFYRLHSDEFIILIESSLHQNLVDETIDIIFNKFMQKQQIEHKSFYTSISVGISSYPEHGDIGSIILKHADIAMIEAKKIRGNHYTIYKSSNHLKFEEPLAFEGKVRHAIEHDLFEVHYQPKYNFKTGYFDGLEALIRWTDQEIGFVSPMTFIPFAERFGFIEDIEEWVIRHVLADIEKWDAIYGIKMHVAINISPAHLAKNNFVERLNFLVQQSNVSPRQLELEITETTIIDINSELINKLKALRRQGYTISIDDFGTGFTCLQNLQILPVNKMKIDRSFISKSTLSEYGRNMALSLLSLGHALKLEIVAEGVETEDEFSLLKQNGCEYMQGYYLAKPMPFFDINHLLQEQKFQMTTL